MVRQTISELDLELSRIDAEYKRRDCNNNLANSYSLFNQSALLRSQSFERNILALLRAQRFTKLTEKKILDVGCGSGGSLLRFLDYGALPSNLFGIDLMAHRIEQAQRLHPAINWQMGSAHQLPYEDMSFDLVISSVVFSSILSEQLRQKIADEMWRVRKSDGLILFYDFTYSNPRNPAVQGVAFRQVKQLFGRPGVKFDFRRVTLAPPISRIIAPHAYWLAYTLEHLKFLNTHLMVVISS